MQAMRAENNGTAANNPRNEAKDFLTKIATRDSERNHGSGESRRHLITTLNRAKATGHNLRKDGILGGWHWCMPENANGKTEEF